jgi:retron-type reverse transcriptase
VTVGDKGTGQGSVISPLLANIYLPYSFDLWAERWRRREATGDMIIVLMPMILLSGSNTRVTLDASWTRCVNGCRSFHCRCIRRRPA